MSRRLAVIVACLAALVVGAVVPVPARAVDGLAITSHTVYEVLPAEGRIAVTVALTLTNVVPDTASGRTYYTGVTLPIPTSAGEVTATSGGTGIPVRVTPSDELVADAEITFSRGVYFNETYPITLRFVVTDAGGAPERETWIRSSFVAFPVWALGTSNAGPASVEVLLPPDYALSFISTEAKIDEGPEATRIAWTSIADPEKFFAYVVAEREVARSRHEIDVAMAERTARIVVRAWPDDPDWADRQAAILTRGLPLLEAEIGIAYPIRGTLNVRQHAYRHLGDYGGWFIEDDDTIDMRFDADPFTTLHEAAHVWMNGSLSSERWLLEGFASYYAEIVGLTLGEPIEVDELTAEVAAHAFPLRDWGRPVIESPTRETYGYAASLVVAREIAAAVDTDGLRAAWRAALDRRPAYAIHDNERRLRGDPRPEEWQRLLDLFENASDADLAGTWRTWVIGEAQAAALPDRAAARDRYATLVEAAGPWELPPVVRRAMEGWTFDAATAEMQALAGILERRDRLEARAAELDLRTTDRLRLAFERDGAAVAHREADAQDVALDGIAAAERRLARSPTLIERIGLWGEPDPAGELETARAAFGEGRNAVAHDHATAAVEARDASADAGRTRIALSGGGALLADAVLLGWLALGRRPSRRAPARTEG
jgi:hypothetical protein